MRRLVGGLLAGLLALGMNAAALLPARAVDCAPNDYICQQLQADQATQASDASQMAAIQGEINDVVKQINDLVAYINRLNVQLTTVQAQIDALDLKIRTTEADITRRAAQLDVRQALFDNRVRSIDKHGTINYLPLVLSSTNFNQLVDRLITAQEIIQADHRMLTDLTAQRTQVQALRDQLASQRAQEAAQRDVLQKTKDQQQAALAYQQQLEAKYKAQADALAAAKAAIDQQVAADQAAYAAEAAASGGGTGQFVWPESPHWVSQGYGCSPYPFELYWPACPTRHFHSGIDIAEPYGTPVFAADNGVASLYSSCCGYGNYIVLTHGNGYATLYGHLAGFNVRNGQLVIRGQVIAYEGSTGNSTGPHLHFEVRYQGNYTDPCSYLGC